MKFWLYISLVIAVVVDGLLHPGSPYMRQITGASLIMAAILLSFQRFGDGGYWRVIIVSTLSQWLVLIALVSAYINIFGVHEMIAHTPSLVTIICLGFCGASGMSFVFNGERKIRRMGICSGAVFAIGVSSFMGHLLGIPALYFSLDRVGGMAMHTSLGFIFYALAAKENIHQLQNERDDFSKAE